MAAYTFFAAENKALAARPGLLLPARQADALIAARPGDVSNGPPRQPELGAKNRPGRQRRSWAGGNGPPGHASGHDSLTLMLATKAARRRWTTARRSGGAGPTGLRQPCRPLSQKATAFFFPSDAWLFFARELPWLLHHRRRNWPFPAWPIPLANGWPNAYKVTVARPGDARKVVRHHGRRPNCSLAEGEKLSAPGLPGLRNWMPAWGGSPVRGWRKWRLSQWGSTRARADVAPGIMGLTVLKTSLRRARETFPSANPARRGRCRNGREEPAPPCVRPVGPWD